MHYIKYICISIIKYSFKWNAYGPNEQFWRVFDRSYWKLRKQNGWNEMRRVEDYRECRLRIRVRNISRYSSGRELHFKPGTMGIKGSLDTETPCHGTT